MLTIDSKLSKRTKDDFGFLIIKENPIAKAGVFEYLLSELDPSISKDDDRIVKVYRPFKEMVANKETFANKPIMWEHREIGENGENSADGAIGSNISIKDDKYLIADLIIYNQDLIKKIVSGEIVELSPAYKQSLKEQKGRFNGEDYEFIQTIESVNHLAVVEKGRSGKDLRIQDSNSKIGGFKMKFKDLAKKLRLIADSCDNIPAKDEDLDRREVIREIMAISAKPNEDFEGGEEEKVETISKLVEKLAYTKDSDDDLEEKEVEDEEEVVEKKEEVVEKDNDFPDNDNGSVAEVAEAIKDIVEKEVERKIETIQDSQRKMQKMISDSYNEVSNALGTQFNSTNMGVNDIYKFGYECLTKENLPKGFDSKTAFRMAFQGRQQKRTPMATDSKVKVESDIIKRINENWR